MKGQDWAGSALTAQFAPACGERPARVPTRPGPRLRLGVLLALAAAAGSPSAADRLDQAAHRNTAPAQLSRVLDGGLSRDERADALAWLVATAEAGDRTALHVLGALYRLGRSHPARLLEQDDLKAALYLADAARRGQLLAMAGLAEIGLTQRDAGNAMLWALLYAHYTKVEWETPRPAQTPRPARNHAYAASLMLRSHQLLADDETLRAQVNADAAAFVSRHDAEVRSGMAVAGTLIDGSAAGPSQLPPSAAYATSRHSPREPAVAIFLVGVDPRGRTERYVVVDSLPDAQVARALRRQVKRLQFRADPSADPLRWTLAPFEYDTRTMGLVDDPP
jgi:hypothetical protein